MKRYGDNLPSSGDDERANDHGATVQVIRGGCGVRYEMLDFLRPSDTPKKRKPLKILSIFRLEQKNTGENGS